MSTTIVLPAIKRSPATLQYRIPNTRPTKFYTPRFVLDPADRAKTIGAEWFRKTDPMMPSYPYGLDVRYPEANEGLYGGMSIRSGSKISKGRNKGKTLRKWFPNVKVERIQSEALDKELTIPIASRVMRTIRKVGGLDQYLTGPKPARIKELGLLGWKLRWMVINSEKWKQEHKDLRAKMGLPTSSTNNPLEETFENMWNTADKRKKLQLVKQQDEKWNELRRQNSRFKRHAEKNIDSDKIYHRIPGFRTLSSFNPSTLGLGNTVVQEVEERRQKNPASDVS